MCTLAIRNIGPIHDVTMTVKRVTMIIGPQSSGKSTVGKILCHCQWIEKRCFNNPEEESVTLAEGFKEGIEEYYRMQGYFSKESYIKYEGTYITLEYMDEKAVITINYKNVSEYQYPKLSYIPASRNFVAMIPNINKYNESNDLLMYFIYDWTTSRDYISYVQLGDVLQKQIEYSYNKNDKNEEILDSGAKIKLQNASSGVQSLLPLFIVSKYLFDGIYKRIKPLSAEQKDQISSILNDFETLKAMTKGASDNEEEDMTTEKKNEISNLVEKISSTPIFSALMNDASGVQDCLTRKFFYKLTSLFIEEAEQNLFPEAQAKLLYWLMSYISAPESKHSVLFTTHSPYLLFALNNCIMGELVKNKLPEEIRETLPSKDSWIDSSEVALYQIDNGKLISIQDEDGLLKENYLNDAYRKNSSEYMTMLTYYDA